MSIPERLYRLAKGKIGEIRDMFDNDDLELDPEVLARIQRSQARKSAREELADSLDGISPAQASPAYSVPPARSTAGLRTPDEIRGGGSVTAGTTAAQTSSDDPLAPHYRLLGVEQGADLATIRSVYEKLSARCKPDRFPPGSPEAAEAQDILNRLESTYKVLREALDPTARRFDMLEL